MSFYGFSRFLCLCFFKLFFRLSITGKYNLDSELGSLILVSNHKSYLDPLVLGLYSKRRLFFMAKNELFSIPVLGYIIKNLGAFPVDRGSHDLGAINYAKSIVDSGEVLALFPEGTRSKTGDILKFKSGAIRIAAVSGCKILPCSIFYAKGCWFRRRIFLEYGKALTLKQLSGGQNFDRANLSHENLIELGMNLRNLIVNMNNFQKREFNI